MRLTIVDNTLGERKHYFRKGIFMIFCGVILNWMVSSCFRNEPTKPDIILVVVNGLRAQDLGYNVNFQVHTPAIDQFAKENVIFNHALAGCSKFSSNRPDFLNGSTYLPKNITTKDGIERFGTTFMTDKLTKLGYKTILSGALPGSTVFDQTHSAIENLKKTRKNASPYFLMLSLDLQYDLLPEKYKTLFVSSQIAVRPNVPDELRDKARIEIARYYAGIAAIDSCMNRLLKALGETGDDENNILVFTSSGGEMLYSQGVAGKNGPWDEVVLVPLLVQFPDNLGISPGIVERTICTAEILSVVLELAGIKNQDTIEERRFSSLVSSEDKPEPEGVFIRGLVPVEWTDSINCSHEFRAVRTSRFTYVCNEKGPWLLYDNLVDPNQMNNLLGFDEYIFIQSDLNSQLKKLLQKNNDSFRLVKR